MTRFRVLPYRQGSKSAKALAEALGGKVLKLEGSTFKPKADDVIINWGYAGTAPVSLVGYEFTGYNGYPDIIRNASNKLNFFNKMKEVNSEIIPQFWTDKGSIPSDAYPIVCRTVLAGHSGAGIVIANSPSELVDASLYVKYLKKKDEYRVHIGKKWPPVPHDWPGNPCGELSLQTVVISVQRKARRTGVGNPNWQVRNLAGGFVYVRNQINPPAGVLESATKALEASGLDFGAVDVIWNAQQEKPYVLEVNTAPGLEGQTITNYANFFNGSV